MLTILLMPSGIQCNKSHRLGNCVSVGRRHKLIQLPYPAVALPIVNFNNSKSKLNSKAS